MRPARGKPLAPILAALLLAASTLEARETLSPLGQLLGAVGAPAARAPAPAGAPAPSREEQAAVFFVANLVERKGVKPFDGAQAARQALDAMIRSPRWLSGDREGALHDALKGLLGSLDRWSRFMSPREFRDYELDTYSKEIGIGLEIFERPPSDRLFKISVVAPGSPAAVAGLKPYEYIVGIIENGVLRHAASMSEDDLIQALKGEPGSWLSIRVKSQAGAGRWEIRDVALRRAEFKAPDIFSEMLEGGVGYLYLEEFTDGVASEFERRLNELAAGGMRRLILDLRFNPGGTLPEEIACTFLKAGDAVMIIKEKGRRYAPSCARDGPYAGLPLAVLVNGESASASEAVAGALRDHHRATFFGARTFGKGCGQRCYPLNSQSGCPDCLKGCAASITFAEFCTPLDRPVADTGIEPDAAVACSADEQTRLYWYLHLRLFGTPVEKKPEDPVKKRALDFFLQRGGTAPPKTLTR